MNVPRRIVALVLAFFLAVEPCGYSAREIPEVKSAIPLLTLPKELGRLDGYFVPSFSSESSFPFVIHIQDAHASPEAQQRIRDILNFIADRDRSQPLLVALEGSLGPLRPEYFDVLPGPTRREEEIVHKLLQNGLLSGAELLAWEEHQKKRKTQVRFIGVETPQLYRENLEVYRDFFKDNAFQKLIRDFRSELISKQTRMLNPALRKFIREVERRREGQYDSEKISPNLQAYLPFLASSAFSNLKIDLRDRFEQIRFPHLSRLLFLIDNEKKIPKRQKIILQSEIHPKKLFQEILFLENQIRERLVRSNTEREFMETFDGFKQLEKLLRFELTAEEYLAISERKEKINPSKLGGQRYAGLIPFYEKALRFYELAKLRDVALLENSLREAKALADFGKMPTLALITGGFHTDGLVALMKEKNIPHFVITPKITSSLPESKRYQQLMSGKWLSSDSFFESSQLAWVRILTDRSFYGQLNDPAEQEEVLSWVHKKAGVAIPKRAEVRTTKDPPSQQGETLADKFGFLKELGINFDPRFGIRAIQLLEKLGSRPPEEWQETERTELDELVAEARKAYEWMTGWLYNSPYYKEIKGHPPVLLSLEGIVSAVEEGRGGRLTSFHGGLGVLFGEWIRGLAYLGGVTTLDPKSEAPEFLIFIPDYQVGVRRSQINIFGSPKKAAYDVKRPKDYGIDYFKDPQNPTQPFEIQIPLYKERDLPQRAVRVRFRLVRVGAIQVIMPSTDFEENSFQADREIFQELYKNHPSTLDRFKQEWVAGLAAYEFRKRLGIPDGPIHLNETATFSYLIGTIRGHMEELLPRYLRETAFEKAAEWAYEDALELTGSRVVFFTHTLVPAGIDRFYEDSVPLGHYINIYFQQSNDPNVQALGGTVARWMIEGHPSPTKKDIFPTFTHQYSGHYLPLKFIVHLAYRHFGTVVAVSSLNAIEALRFFIQEGLFDMAETPPKGWVRHVTNGVDHLFWMSRGFLEKMNWQAADMKDRQPEAILDPGDPQAWELIKLFGREESLPSDFKWGGNPLLSDQELLRELQDNKIKAIDMIRHTVREEYIRETGHVESKQAEGKATPEEIERLRVYRVRWARWIGIENPEEWVKSWENLPADQQRSYVERLHQGTLVGLLDPALPLYVWARRIVEYKRLLFTVFGDHLPVLEERIRRIVYENPGNPRRVDATRLDEIINSMMQLGAFDQFVDLVVNRKIQFVFAGKTFDEVGRSYVAILNRIIWRLSQRYPEIQDRVVFLEDYNEVKSQFLVRGADGWLNTPKRPLEASGTSGMKTANRNIVSSPSGDGWNASGVKDKLNGRVLEIFSFLRNDPRDWPPQLRTNKAFLDYFKEQSEKIGVEKVIYRLQDHPDNWPEELKNIEALVQSYYVDEAKNYYKMLVEEAEAYYAPDKTDWLRGVRRWIYYTAMAYDIRRGLTGGKVPSFDPNIPGWPEDGEEIGILDLYVESVRKEAEARKRISERRRIDLVRTDSGEPKVRAEVRGRNNEDLKAKINSYLASIRHLMDERKSWEFFRVTVQENDEWDRKIGEPEEIEKALRDIQQIISDQFREIGLREESLKEKKLSITSLREDFKNVEEAAQHFAMLLTALDHLRFGKLPLRGKVQQELPGHGRGTQRHFTFPWEGKDYHLLVIARWEPASGHQARFELQILKPIEEVRPRHLSTVKKDTLTSLRIDYDPRKGDAALDFPDAVRKLPNTQGWHRRRIPSLKEHHPFKEAHPLFSEFIKQLDRKLWFGYDLKEEIRTALLKGFKKRDRKHLDRLFQLKYRNFPNYMAEQFKKNIPDSTERRRWLEEIITGYMKEYEGSFEAYFPSFQETDVQPIVKILGQWLDTLPEDFFRRAEVRGQKEIDIHEYLKPENLTEQGPWRKIVSPIVFRFLNSFLGRSIDSDDLYQEAILALLELRQKIEAGEIEVTPPPEPYLRQVIGNRFLSLLRRPLARKTIQEGDKESNKDLQALLAHGMDEKERIEWEEEIIKLMNLTNSLPENYQRTVFAVMEELRNGAKLNEAYENVSKKTRTSTKPLTVATIKTRFWKARQELIKRWGVEALREIGIPVSQPKSRAEVRTEAIKKELKKELRIGPKEHLVKLQGILSHLLSSLATSLNIHFYVSWPGSGERKPTPFVEKPHLRPDLLETQELVTDFFSGFSYPEGRVELIAVSESVRNDTLEMAFRMVQQVFAFSRLPDPFMPDRLLSFYHDAFLRKAELLKIYERTGQWGRVEFEIERPNFEIPEADLPPEENQLRQKIRILEEIMGVPFFIYMIDFLRPSVIDSDVDREYPWLMYLLREDLLRDPNDWRFPFVKKVSNLAFVFQAPLPQVQVEEIASLFKESLQSLQPASEFRDQLMKIKVKHTEDPKARAEVRTKLVEDHHALGPLLQLTSTGEWKGSFRKGDQALLREGLRDRISGIEQDSYVQGRLRRLFGFLPEIPEFAKRFGLAVPEAQAAVAHILIRREESQGAAALKPQAVLWTSRLGLPSAEKVISTKEKIVFIYLEEAAFGMGLLAAIPSTLASYGSDAHAGVVAAAVFHPFIDSIKKEVLPGQKVVHDEKMNKLLDQVASLKPTRLVILRAARDTYLSPDLLRSLFPDPKLQIEVRTVTQADLEWAHQFIPGLVERIDALRAQIDSLRRSA